MNRIVLLFAALAAVMIAGSLYLRAEGSGHPTAADGDGADAKAVLRNAAGERVGSVKFADEEDGVHVKVVIDEPLDGGPFHGFHVHANDDDSITPGNGAGCIAPSFVSADGHFKETGQNHPAHNGDMPVLLENADGSAEARLVTDRYSVAEVIGKAVIVHASPDNYANIPTRYSATGADQATLNTGDAGGRVACGVIEGD